MSMAQLPSKSEHICYDVTVDTSVYNGQLQQAGAAMAEETVTIALDGDITLADFVETVRLFEGLLDALSQEIADGTTVEWRIDDLQVGSAVTTVRGMSVQPEVTERIIRGIA